ncbi:25891_t:CDS:2 [Gigaspora margarita]|uniref:25891_t:CDS:1 n=1 Tax=Gigaspora margarita TaxID=4874 RepID=A0ABN7USK7_GIGMA|nr:25891_t:CDS:2 [Gigaspora margarita]
MHFATSLKIKFIIFLCLLALNIEAKNDQCKITTLTKTKFCTVTKRIAATETDTITTLVIMLSVILVVPPALALPLVDVHKDKDF